jgi:hypothetical protein
MLIDYKTGRVAYHAYVFKEKGGLDFIQFDFDGSIKERREVRAPLPLITNMPCN